jgi:hypothetical protein
MLVGFPSSRPVATVDVNQLSTVWWGPMRQLCPGFVEDIELGRYLKKLLASSSCRAVRLEPHRDASGQKSTHVFDVFFVDDAV